MARISKEEQARRDGFDYFVRLYKSQKVRIPEIDDEIQRRNLTGKPIGMDKKTEEDFSLAVKTIMLDTVLIMTEWVLHDKFGFGKTRLNRFKECFNDASDSIDKDYLTWSDLRTTLREETGIQTEATWFGRPIENEGYSNGG